MQTSLRILTKVDNKRADLVLSSSEGGRKWLFNNTVAPSQM